jgi:hypothetical protein
LITHVDFERDYAPLTVERSFIDAVRVQHPNAPHEQPSFLVDGNIDTSVSCLAQLTSESTAWNAQDAPRGELDARTPSRGA